MVDLKELVVMLMMLAIGWGITRWLAARAPDFGRPLVDTVGKAAAARGGRIRFAVHRLRASPDQRNVGLELVLSERCAVLLNPAEALALAQLLEHASSQSPAPSS